MTWQWKNEKRDRAKGIASLECKTSNSEPCCGCRRHELLSLLLFRILVDYTTYDWYSLRSKTKRKLKIRINLYTGEILGLMGEETRIKFYKSHTLGLAPETFFFLSFFLWQWLPSNCAKIRHVTDHGRPGSSSARELESARMARGAWSSYSIGVLFSWCHVTFRHWTKDFCQMQQMSWWRFRLGCVLSLDLARLLGRISIFAICY